MRFELRRSLNNLKIQLNRGLTIWIEWFMRQYQVTWWGGGEVVPALLIRHVHRLSSFETTTVPNFVWKFHSYETRWNSHEIRMKFIVFWFLWGGETEQNSDLSCQSTRSTGAVGPDTACGTCWTRPGARATEADRVFLLLTNLCTKWGCQNRKLN